MFITSFRVHKLPDVKKVYNETASDNTLLMSTHQFHARTIRNIPSIQGTIFISHSSVNELELRLEQIFSQDCSTYFEPV